MPVTPLEVFISYAHADASLRKELEKHLSLLQQRKLITSWHDRQIPAGAEWEGEIDAHLNSAQIILLLISADFLSSRYCYGIEMKRALERHHAGEARVIPIILRPVDWEQEPSLHMLQALPTNAKAVTTWPMPPTYDEAFQDIAREIRKVVEEYGKHPVTAIANIAQVWNVPYRRNPFFTGQESILTQLYTTLNANKFAALTQAQAISGLGGIGKTQIALEYAYRHERAYRAILWVQSDTRDAIVSGFSDLAGLLHLPEKDEQDQHLVVEAVKRWLEMHEQWLLILDNADDLDLLEEFLPTRSKGHILLTTRVQAQGTIANGIEVVPMEGAEGALLLLRRAKVLPPKALLEEGTASDLATAKEIVHELGGLPLALDQAAAYIEETACGLEGYLKRYRAQHTILLQRRGMRAREHPEPVATTWSLSFAKVEEISPTAADFLRLCAFLHPDAIPEELLTGGMPNSFPSLLTQTNSATVFDEAFATLRAYSLVHRHPETATLSIHPLVQAVLKDSLSNYQQRQLAKRVVHTVNRLFPSSEFANWKRCERYLLHAQTCAALIVRWYMAFPEAARLLNVSGSYLLHRGRHAEAEPLWQRALEIQEQQLGQDHPNTATSLNNLALLYRAQGRYAEAEPLLQRALAIREQQLGQDHPNTAMSLDSLGNLYQDQEKYAEAEPLLQRALAIREQQLGATHPDTITSLDSLGNLYRVQGKYTEAEPLLQRALAICEQLLGQDHPFTAASLNNLSLLYRAQGRYAEAEPLLQRALEIQEHQLGQDHPEMARVLGNLARLCQDQEKYAEAELLYQRALAICEQQLGATHPDTAMSLDSLGNLYRVQGKYTEAEPLLQRALAIREQQLGQDHPNTATTRKNYALLLQNMQ